MLLYKYLTTERFDVLQNGRIRFTQHEDLNDPFDLNPAIESLAASTDLRELLAALRRYIAQGRYPFSSVEAMADGLLKIEAQIAGDISPKRAIGKEDVSNFLLSRAGNEMNAVRRDKYIIEHVSGPLAGTLEFLMAIDNAKDEGQSKRDALIENLDRNPNNYKQIAELLLQGIEWALTTFDDMLEMFFRQSAYPFIQSVIKGLGILSLTEDKSNQSMWAHYANNHEGFVIGFDTSSSFFDFTARPGKCSLMKVRYQERQAIKSLTSEFLKTGFTLEALYDLFLLKTPEWENEREWRAFRGLEDADSKVGQKIYLFSFPPDAIKQVVLGSLMESTMKQKFLGLLKDDKRYRHVEVFQAELSGYPVKFNLRPLN